MTAVTLEFLNEQLELGEQLLRGRDSMFEPQDLPGRYGRVIAAVDRILAATGCEAVVGGGWAVWRHGYFGRMTQDVDIVLAAEDVDAFLKVASVSGFEILPVNPGRWPKLLHKVTDVKVNILPEGERPGTPSKPAPTTIPHPGSLGTGGAKLTYSHLKGLIGLKLAAGRARDEGDVVELIRANPDQTEAIRAYLESVHADYAAAFDVLTERAREQLDE